MSDRSMSDRSIQLNKLFLGLKIFCAEGPFRCFTEDELLKTKFAGNARCIQKNNFEDYFPIGDISCRYGMERR